MARWLAFCLVGWLTNRESGDMQSQLPTGCLAGRGVRQTSGHQDGQPSNMLLDVVEHTCARFSDVKHSLTYIAYCVSVALAGWPPRWLLNRPACRSGMQQVSRLRPASNAAIELASQPGPRKGNMLCIVNCVLRQRIVHVYAQLHQATNWMAGHPDIQ